MINDLSGRIVLRSRLRFIVLLVRSLIEHGSRFGQGNQPINTPAVWFQPQLIAPSPQLLPASLL